MRIAITEINTDTVWLLTLRLQQITVTLYLLEGQHHNIIGIEMGVRHLQDIINVQSVAPNSILTGVWLGIGRVGLMRESYHLTLLGKHIVTIHILQSIDTILARGYTTNAEMTATIRAGNAEQRFCTES